MGKFLAVFLWCLAAGAAWVSFGAAAAIMRKGSDDLFALVGIWMFGVVAYKAVKAGLYYWAKAPSRPAEQSKG